MINSVLYNFTERHADGDKKRQARSFLWFFILSLIFIPSIAKANTVLELNTLETSQFGYAYNGIYTNQATADFSFQGNATDLQLTIDTYDIDTNSEIEVLINGVSLTFLSKTANNGTGQDGITIPISAQVAGTNTLQFKQKIPGWIWGVSNLLLSSTNNPQLVIDVVDSNAYGYKFNGVNSHRNGAEFNFQGAAEELTLNFDTYDIDTTSELNVLVNGQSIGYAKVTSNNSSGNTTLSIPSSAQVPGVNTLKFVQVIPGWIWGIENLHLEISSQSVELLVGTTQTDDYGFAFNGIYANKDKAVFQFQGTGSALELSLNTFDIDTNSEVDVLLNGSTIGSLSTTANNSTGSSTFTLPVVDQGSTNSLTFQQSIPGWRWGITDLLLDTASDPQLIHDVIHTQAYGYAYSGAISKITSAEFTFVQAANNLLLELNTYDIDDADEIMVLVNGIQLGFLATTSNNSEGSSSLLIPVSYQIPGTNTLSFVQKTNGWRWGISDIVLNTQPPSLPSLSQYEMVFNDEFNGASLNTNNWNTGLLWGPYLQINGEQQLYVDTLGINQNANHSPFNFTGESLIISATPVGGGVQPPTRPDENDSVWDEYNEYRFNGPSSNGPGYSANDIDYLSGVITSYESFKMTHGYVETRAKVPKGQGLWPAFWLLNSHYVEDSPEIDVMEFLGHQEDTIYNTYHYFEPSNNWAKVSTPSFEHIGPDWTQAFHTFGMAWSPTAIVWYVDGVETNRITDAEYKISSQAMYIIANLAVGGSWPGDADGSTPFPAEYEIDYIRAYKKKLSPTLNLANDYQLMFNDEFSGNTLDTAKWNTSFLWGPYYAINNEEQYYVDTADTDENIGYTPFDVSNGILTITAESKDNSPANVPPPVLPAPNEQIWIDNPSFQQGPYAGAPDYTSGMITSYDAFKFVNGYAEIKAKVPAGDGLWPAFWLLNAYYVGPLPEIDIMEILGENPSTAYHTFHRSDTNGVAMQDQATSSHGTPTAGYSDDFHTFGVHWQPGKITWYVDGQVVDTYTEPTNDNRAYQLMYVIANLAVGGNFNSQPVDPTAVPAKFEIDYIRVYQEKDTP